MEVEKTENKLTVDQILPYVGEFGRFQKILDAMVFTIFCPVAFHPIIMYFSTLVPSWKCIHINGTTCPYNGTFTSDDTRMCNIQRDHWMYVEGKDFSLVTQFDLHCDQKWILHLVTSMFFVGQGVGAIINGWMADRFGRKKFLFPAVAMALLIGFVTPFMPSIYLVIVCRFVIGFFYPGVCVQSFVLLSELVGTDKRPKATLIPYLSYPTAWMLLALKAYLLRNWKTLSIVCTAPYVFVLGFYPFIPESVRWLQQHDRPEEAMEIFRKIARWNKKQLPSNIVLADPKVVVTTKINLLDLVRSRQVALHTGVQTFMWTVIALTFYGLQLSANDLEGSVYRDFVLLCLVEIPATFLTIVSCNKFGRKKTGLPPLLFAGIALLCIAFMPETVELKPARIALGIVGKLFTSITYKALYVWSTEIFPTDVRAVGMGILQVGSRLGSSSSPWVAKGLKPYGHYVPFMVMGITSLMSAIMGMCLPETANAPLKETNIENGNAVTGLDEPEKQEMKTIAKNV